MLTPAVLDALVADPGGFIEGRGNQWLFCRVKERVAQEAMATFLDRGLGLIETLLGAAPGSGAAG